MNIVFVSFLPMDFNTNTPFEIPLGGTESAICYLAIELANRGHQVSLYSHTSHPGFFRGVHCHNIAQSTPQQLSHTDFAVISSLPDQIEICRKIFPSKTKFIMWTGHAPDQPVSQSLADEKIKNQWDGLAFVSAWQKENYKIKFGVDDKKSFVLKNAISPAFENLFSSEGSLLAQKKPTLVYTSTPFRGLNLLPEIFPKIKSRVPSVTLQVFSSMSVYGMNKDDEAKNYSELYNKLKNTDGIFYRGSIPQPELAKELKNALVLSYPNTFPETSCIAVMEAMAAGLKIITSQLGALPETAAQFGTYIPIVGNPNYAADFERACGDFLEKALSRSPESENLLREQVDIVNQVYTWKFRAKEWENAFLSLQ